MSSVTFSSPGVLGAFTQAQIQGLVANDILGITGSNIAELSDQQLGWFSAEQVVSIQPAVLSAVSPLVINGFTDAAVAAFTSAQIAALTSAQVAALSAVSDGDSKFDHFTAAQMGAFSAAQFPSIDAATFPLLSTAQVNLFSASAMAVMSQAQFAQFGQAQVDGLFGPVNPTLIESVSVANCVSHMTPAQLGYVGQSHVSSMTKEQIAGMSVATFKTVSEQQLQNMTNDQLGAITSAQFVELSASQMNAGIGARMDKVKVVCIGSLTASQIGDLNSTSVHALTGDQIRSLTTSAKVQGLGSKLADAQYSELSGSQIPYLANSVVAGLSNAVIVALSTGSKLLKNATGEQLSHVTASQFPSIDSNLFPELSTAKINYLSGASVATMTQAQFAKFGQSQIEGLFGPTNATLIESVSPANCVAHITEAQLGWVALNVSALTPAQVAAISPSVFNKLSNAQLEDLTEAQCGAVTGAQFAALSAAQINVGLASSVSDVPANSVSDISAVVLSGLTSASAGFLTEQQIQAISTDKIQSLNVTAISAAQIGYLTPAQVAALSTTQVTNLSNAQIEKLSDVSGETSLFTNFTTSMLGAVKASQMSHVDPEVFAFLSHTQIASFSSTAVAAMTSGQFAKFSEEQIDGLFVEPSPRIPYVSNSIISEISGNQLLAIGTENIRALSNAQFASIPAILFNASTANAISNAMLSVLTDAQLGALTASQYAQLNSSQVNATIGTRYGKVNVACVPTPTQMSGFTTSVLNAFTPEQIRALPSTCVRYLSVYQIGFLTAAQISDLNSNEANRIDLTASQVVAVSQNILGFTNSQLSSVVVTTTPTVYPPVHQLALLGSKAVYLSATQLNAMNAEQFAAITVSDISGSVINNLSDSWFSSEFTGGMTAGQVAAMNATTTSELSRAAAQAIMNSSKVTSMNYFGSVTATAFDVSFNNAASVSVEQARVMTTSQVAAFANIKNLSTPSLQALMNVASPNLLASISSNSVTDISSVVFGNGFTGAARIIPSQARNLRAQQLGAFTISSVQSFPVNCFAVLQSSQVIGFSAAQVAVMSENQIEALPVDSKIIIMGIAQSNSISPLNIKLTAFNTLLTSPYFASAKSSDEVTLEYDAVVSFSMPIDNARSMFKYEHDTDGTTRLYFDKNEFAVRYRYGASSNAVKDISSSMYPSEPSLFGTRTITYTDPSGLEWVGPVTEESIPGDTNIAVSWDYILYTAKNVFNYWAAFTYFNNIYASEKEFRNNLNNAINTQIEPVFERVDSSSASAQGASITKMLDSGHNKYYTVLQTASTPDNISSTVFDYMYIRQPQRFIEPSESTNVLYSFPFIAGDTLNFVVTVNAHANQTVLETSPSGGNTIAIVEPRTYLMKITIAA